MDNYKISNKDNKSYKYTYNRDFKCNVYKVEGQRKNNFRMPADGKSSLAITARYLVIQLRLVSSANATITIQLGDDSGNHFNFAFSTLSCKRPSSSQMCALINLPLQKERWLNICFDLQQIAANYWPSGSFQTLDSIEISPVCYVRDMYATNNPLSSEGNGTDLPKLYTYPAGIGSTNVLVPDAAMQMQVEKEKKEKRELRESKELKPKSTSRTTPTEIRLGTKSPKIGQPRSSAHPKSPVLPNFEPVDPPSSSPTGNGHNSFSRVPEELTVEGIGTTRSAIPRRSNGQSCLPKKKPLSASKEEKEPTPPFDKKYQPASKASPKNSPQKQTRPGKERQSGIPSKQTKPKAPPKPEAEPEPNRGENLLEDDDDSDYSDSEAFGSVPAASDRANININPELPMGEEEELELVYIEALNCYYCPSNQQYYELDAH